MRGTWTGPGRACWPAADGFAILGFVEDGYRFADRPIVLDFDGIQMKICHWKFDELSIGWHTIDTTAAMSGWEYVEQTPAWSDADERREPFIDQELREVALLEWAIITS